MLLKVLLIEKSWKTYTKNFCKLECLLYLFLCIFVFLQIIPKHPGMASPLLKNLMYILLITLHKDCANSSPWTPCTVDDWEYSEWQMVFNMPFLLPSFFFFFNGWELQKRNSSGKTLEKENPACFASALKSA